MNSELNPKTKALESDNLSAGVPKESPAKLNAEAAAIPAHVGIIMDGNRRWARSEGKHSSAGHERGADVLEVIIRHAAKRGVRALTFYAFSTENWKKRTRREIKDLFRVMKFFVKNRVRAMKKNGAALEIIGEMRELPWTLRRGLERAKRILKNNERIKINIALNYGGRHEIVRAVKRIVDKGFNANEINEEIISKNLYTNGQPDPDLIIRTGGELRLSNFLIWQASYSELYFTDTLWPDFGPKEFDKALAEFARRQRRFGQ